MFCLSYINWSQYFLITLPEETFTAVLLPWETLHRSAPRILQKTQNITIAIA